MSKLVEAAQSPLLVRLWREYIYPYRKRIFYSVFCMLLAAGATAANAWIMQPVLDEIFLKQDRTMLAYLPLGVFLIALFKAWAGYQQMVIMKTLGQRITSDLQMTLFNHLLYADIALFSRESSGKLLSRFSNDIQVIRRNLTNVMVGLVRESITLVALVGVMFYQSWQLSLIAFSVFPLAVLPVLKMGRRMRKVSHHTQEELGALTSTLDDTFQGIRVVKSYRGEKFESMRASMRLESLLRLYTKSARIDSAPPPLMEALGGLAIAGVVWYGGVQVLEGSTTPGAFFSFIAALIMAYRPAKMLSNINTGLQEGLAAIERFFNVIDTKPMIADRADAKPLILGSGKVELADVSFRYHSDEPILTHVSLVANPGERVALVGESGGGKSTIMNLILRFYDVESGKILIDDQDIRHVTLDSLRRHISVVSQENVLFDDTIRANIAYAIENPDEQAVIEAAKAAAAHEFISALPQGYDTLVGQHGMRLSGGQRQRIAIARAMLKNAPILLLDEATSALDPVSEKLVQEALDRLMENRTTLVIAHRLSTVIDADRLYVIRRGEVAESGTHQELLAKGGVYSMLFKKQFGS